MRGEAWLASPISKKRRTNNRREQRRIPFNEFGVNRGLTVRTSTFVMIGFAVLFGLLAVFLAQVWLNNQADQRLKSIEAQRKAPAPARTVVVATRALRFGDELTAQLLREQPWPEDAVPQGAFARIADLTQAKRVVLMPIDANEAVLAAKITGPGQRATLSAMLQEGMKAVTVRVNDVEGVAGFVLPGDHVDVLLTRQSDKNMAVNDVVIQNARVLAIDQLADARAEKPSVVKAVTLEVDVTDGQKIALAATVGTLSLLLRKAGELADDSTRRVTQTDFGRPETPVQNARFATVAVIRPSREESFKRWEYSVPIERADGRAAALLRVTPARE
jgi:pilus assembly protein CpaB